MTIENGLFVAPSGRLDLGSVAGPTAVDLVPTASGFALEYEATSQFGEIRISGGSALATSGEGGGIVRIQGGNIDISGGSVVSAVTLGDRDGSGLSIRGDRFSLREGSELSSSAIREGNAGAITLSADEIRLSDRAAVLSDTLVKEMREPLPSRPMKFVWDGGSFVISSSVLRGGNAGAVTFSANEFSWAGVRLSLPILLQKEMRARSIFLPSAFF